MIIRPLGDVLSFVVPIEDMKNRIFDKKTDKISRNLQPEHDIHYE